MTWRENLVTDAERLAELIAGTRSIAVIGIKPESQADRPAHYVPRYLAERGFEIWPLPVYDFGLTRILGRPIHRRMVDLPEAIDMVLVFRRSADVARHLGEMLDKRPSCVWMQLGIRDEVSAEALARAGVRVVQDRCLMVDHRRLVPPPGIPAPDGSRIPSAPR